MQQNSPICTVLGSSILCAPYSWDEAGMLSVTMKRMIAEQIRKMYDSGVRRFFCNGEQGISMWTAEAILSLRETFSDVVLYLIAPIEGQELLWEKPLQDRYHRIFEAADKTLVMANVPDCNRATAIWLTNCAMLEMSSCVFADDPKNPMLAYAKTLQLHIWTAV